MTSPGKERLRRESQTNRRIAVPDSLDGGVFEPWVGPPAEELRPLMSETSLLTGNGSEFDPDLPRIRHLGSLWIGCCRLSWD